MATDLAVAALDLVGQGFRVFPLRPRGKEPAIKGWQSAATSEQALVAEMWARHPDRNIGIACGEGLVIIDADSAAGEAVAEELGMPATCTVRTSKGTHYYLAGNAGNRVRIAEGLDTRGSGGLVVGAGSIHPSGHVYAWIVPPWEVPPAPMPEAIQDLLQAGRRGKTPCVGSSSTPAVLTPDLARGVVDEGERNTYLHRVASSLRGRFGLTVDELLATLQAMNTQRCHPPLGTDEVQLIAASAAKYDAAPPWVIDPQGFAADPALSSGERQVLVALARYAGPSGRCYPSIERLRRDTGKCRNAIVRDIDGLVRTGRITVERGRQGRSNRYKLLSVTPDPRGDIRRGSSPHASPPSDSCARTS